MTALHSVNQETQLKSNRTRWHEVCCDSGSDLLVGQCGTEMLLDVGLQHCVEVLEFSVSNQTDDINLSEAGRIRKRFVYTDVYTADEELCKFS